MRIYVAGKFEDRKRCREIMTVLESWGHTITRDWTTADQFTAAEAFLDYEGVMAANALVIVAEQAFPFRGTYVEFGIAVARGIPIYLMGGGMDACIFTLLPRVERGIKPLLQRAVYKH